MESQDILLVCAGALFFVIFIWFIVVAVKRSKAEKEKMNRIKFSYVSEDLKKMGYDFVYSEEDGATFEAAQVTIDDIIGSVQPQASDKTSQKSDEPLFSKIDNDGVEEITGNFKA